MQAPRCVFTSPARVNRPVQVRPDHPRITEDARCQWQEERNRHTQDPETGPSRQDQMHQDGEENQRRHCQGIAHIHGSHKIPWLPLENVSADRAGVIHPDPVAEHPAAVTPRAPLAHHSIDRLEQARPAGHDLPSPASGNGHASTGIACPLNAVKRPRRGRRDGLSDRFSLTLLLLLSANGEPSLFDEQRRRLAHDAPAEIPLTYGSPQV